MAYLGNTPTTQGFIPAIDYFSGNGATVAFTLSRPVASVAQVQATIENVPQNPGTAFTVSGNTITFDGAPPSGTNNIYVYYTSPITQVIAPSQGTVFPSTLSVPNALFWNTSSNVGVGTTSPTARLHTQVSSGNTIARFVNTSSTVGELGELILAAPNRPAVRTNYQTSVDSNGFFNYDSGSFIWFNNSGGSATERMRIDSAGRVTTPSQPRATIEYSSTTITAATLVTLTGGSASLNVGSMYNSVNGRYTCPVAGIYRLTISSDGKQADNANAGSLYYGVNGPAYAGQTLFYGNAYNGNCSSFLISLSANDFVVVCSFGNNGVTYTLNNARATFELVG